MIEDSNDLRLIAFYRMHEQEIKAILEPWAYLKRNKAYGYSDVNHVVFERARKAGLADHEFFSYLNIKTHGVDLHKADWVTLWRLFLLLSEFGEV